MKKPKITFRGWPGHFICADRCQFRLNTLVEYKEHKIVVSTVGLMQLDGSPDWKPIGYNRYFETMVFEAKENDPYCDIDVGKELSFFRAYETTDELLAQHGHYAVIDEVCAWLVGGGNAGKS